MNLLKKQGFYNSIILYLGTAIGFFNFIVLFNRYLTIEEIGFYNLMIAIAGLFAMVASMGINSIILKYYPVFRTEGKDHRGFITFVILFSTLGFSVFTLLFICFRGPVISIYQHKTGASLLVDHYYYLIPISFFTLVFSILESLARAVFKNVYSAFLREFLLRLLTSIAVLLMALSLINYNGFLNIYLVSNFIIILLLFANIYRGKHFRITPISPEIRLQYRELLRYGLFGVLGGGSFSLVQNMDMLMLSTITEKSLRLVGIYSTFFIIAQVISMPSKALSRTSYQIVSEAWAQNDLGKINRVYSKTSIVQFIIGCLLLVGLIINKDHIIFLLHKPEYKGYFDVFIVIGLAFLVDITGGLNGQIINFSKYYRYSTYWIAAAVVFCAILNLILIPPMGLLGAALAYLLTMVALNFKYWYFLKKKYQLQPFNISYLYVSGVSLVCLLVGLFLPALPRFIIDLLYRSSIVTILYAVAIYYLHISPDINKLIEQILSMLMPWRKGKI